jgi:CO/xanthine dehydrogenase Mo-binding subunit
MGGPVTAVIAPAVVNAVVAAAGKRLRKLPISRLIRFAVCDVDSTFGT